MDNSQLVEKRMTPAHYTWEHGGKRYQAVFCEEEGGWEYELIEVAKAKFRAAWSNTGEGYHSRRGAMRACASAFKKREGLSRSLELVMVDLFKGDAEG